MICPKCKKLLEEDANFCSACGEQIAKNAPIPSNNKQSQTAPTQEPEKLKNCKVCGESIPESAICCPKCGKFAGGIKKDPPKNNTNAAKPAPTVNVKTCKACGRKIAKSAFYCPFCNKMADTAPAPAVAPTGASNGFAVAAFILSFFVPILGLIFGILGLRRANEGADGRGFCIAAIIISVIPLAMSLLVILIALNLSAI